MFYDSSLFLFLSIYPNNTKILIMLKCILVGIKKINKTKLE